MPVTQILVVDDYLPWQRFVQSTLEAHLDLKVIASATDGREAVEKAKRLQPDVILMDLGLPGMNGLDATQQIRTLSPASKILFLSEQRGSELIEAAFQVGASGYILKSDANADLVAGIKAILGGQPFISHSLKDRRDIPD